MADDLVNRIDHILGFPEMSQDIADCLGENGEEEFTRLVQRVEGRFEASANYPLLLRFIDDYSKTRDDELVRLFEFIYSSLINNFKGELAELFARHRITEFAKAIGRPSAESILGIDIRERGKRGRAWLKGADGLLCFRTEGRLQIIAVVEIKAMQRPVPRLIDQIESHIERMRRGGVRIGDGEVAATSIDIVHEDGRTSALTDCSVSDITSLLVRPWISSEDGKILQDPNRPNVWLAELRYTQDEITEAAYRFGAWYFSRVGPKVFYAVGEESRGRRPAPHPEDSLEANGENSFIAALFGVWQRDLFQPRAPEDRRGGARTPGDTFLWLYNSFCGGYETADTKDIYFPSFEPDLAHKARRVRGKEALDAFAAGRFAEALALLPDPAEQKDLWTRRREWIMFARIRGWAGDFASARAALEAARHEPPTINRAIPLEIAAAECILFLREGRSVEGSECLTRAVEILDRVQAEIAEHRTNRWQFPSEIDVRALNHALIDLATVHARIGRTDHAKDLLLALVKPDALETARIANDALFSSLA